MKKALSIALALVMLLGIAPVVFADAKPAAWDAENKCFKVTAGPKIDFLKEDTNHTGTNFKAWFTNSDEMLNFQQYLESYDDKNELISECLNKEAKYCTVSVSIQFAYSFDGVTWINTDEDTGEKPTTEYDKDGDGFSEYYNLPTVDLDPAYRSNSADIFEAGSGSLFTPHYCNLGDSGLSIEQGLNKYNAALLGGVGRQSNPDLGNSFDEDDGLYGYYVDFDNNTISVKARYRVYTKWEYKESEEPGTETVKYSEWGNTKTYNNSKKTPELQDCYPEPAKLKTNDPGELSLIRSKVTKGETTAYEFWIRYDAPAAIKDTLDKFYSLDNETREYITGEHDDPHLVFEALGKDGNWYIFSDNDYNTLIFSFYSDYYDWAHKLAALGITDTLKLRARMIGQNTYKKEDAYHHEDTGEDVYKLTADGEHNIISGVSNVLELNLSGIYKIYYHCDGGYFLPDTEQKDGFDDDSAFVIDLTSNDYTLAKQNYNFRGWFEDRELKTQITSIDTGKSKKFFNLYAKWEERAFYPVTYNMNGYTGDVSNPNPDKIHVDEGDNHDGKVALKVAGAEATFLGWYDAATGGNKITELSYAAMGGPKTLYAHWDLQTVKITYNDAFTNNTKNPAQYVVAMNGDNTHYIYAASRTGYIFDGWFYDKELTHQLPKDTGKNAWILNESKDITIYAKWIKGRWDIKYVFEPKDVYNSNPDKYTYGESINLKDPSLAGYTFGGWFTDKEYTKAATGISSTDEGVKTFYGKMNPITYKINYVISIQNPENYFTNANKTTRTVNDAVTFSPLVPKTADYKFIGWFNNVNGDGDPLKGIAAGTANSVTVYAKTYKYRWGDVNMDNEITVEDARLALRHAVKLEKIPDDFVKWGNLDMDSKISITVEDARLILRMAVKLETEQSLKLPARP